ncbi:hypothetical protein Sjap_007124 [Stephania japonica]|uniref:Uncharacterized protein n=1 Tax=Stephania japonica TaxID=461633 RepID=A0AAP0JP77_9MAGN
MNSAKPRSMHKINTPQDTKDLTWKTLQIRGKNHGPNSEQSTISTKSTRYLNLTRITNNGVTHKYLFQELR